MYFILEILFQYELLSLDLVLNFLRWWRHRQVYELSYIATFHTSELKMLHGSWIWDSSHLNKYPENEGDAPKENMWDALTISYVLHAFSFADTSEISKAHVDTLISSSEDVPTRWRMPTLQIREWAGKGRILSLPVHPISVHYIYFSGYVNDKMFCSELPSLQHLKQHLSCLM